eukprot:10394776-Karenia_brevis.AAC.1
MRNACFSKQSPNLERLLYLAHINGIMKDHLKAGGREIRIDSAAELQASGVPLKKIRTSRNNRVNKVGRPELAYVNAELA